MKACFIFNPSSGRNRRDPSLARSLPALARRGGLDAELVFTRAPHHATQLARNAIARGCQRIIAVGGDGTLNEVAQAVLGSGAALGLVPCGSGNGLARHLGLPSSPSDALALVADRAAMVVAIDAGEANGHLFCNAMGLGFDAEISARFNRLTRRGLPAYIRTGWSAYRQHCAEPLRLVAANTDFSFDSYLLAVANSAQYGNDAFIAPGASVFDGRLDLVALPGRPQFLPAVRQVARLFFGTLDREKSLIRFAATEFTIVRQHAGIIHTDGEVRRTSAEIRVRVLPRALRVIAPAPLAERRWPFRAGTTTPVDTADHPR